MPALFSLLFLCPCFYLSARSFPTSSSLKECFKLLQARFPGSNRVRRLRAAQHEADGEFDQARDIYEAMLKVNPADAVSFRWGL